MSKIAPLIIITSATLAITAFIVYKSATAEINLEYCPEISLQEDFDLNRFAEKAWYPLLRIDDLPYRDVDCMQHNIDGSTSPMEFHYDWYYPETDAFRGMDRPLICDE